MANNTTAGNSTSPDIRRFREVTAAVVAELRAAEVRNTFAAISIEELADEQISRLEAGASTDPIRPARADRIKKIYDDFIGSIDSIKSLPPEAFTPVDTTEDET